MRVVLLPVLRGSRCPRGRPCCPPRRTTRGRGRALARLGRSRRSRARRSARAKRDAARAAARRARRSRSSRTPGRCSSTPRQLGPTSRMPARAADGEQLALARGARRRRSRRSRRRARRARARRARRALARDVEHGARPARRSPPARPARGHVGDVEHGGDARRSSAARGLTACSGAGEAAGDRLCEQLAADRAAAAREAPTTATDARAQDTCATAATAAIALALLEAPRAPRASATSGSATLELAGLRRATCDREAGLSRNTSIMRWFSGSTSAVERLDALGARPPRPGGRAAIVAMPAPLPVVGDRERDLGARRRARARSTPWPTIRSPATASSDERRSGVDAAASSGVPRGSTPALKKRSQRDSAESPARNVAQRRRGRPARRGARATSSRRAARRRRPARPSRGARVDEAVLERVPDQLGAGGAAELLLDVRAVRLDRAHAQVELGARSRCWCGRARSAAAPRPRARVRSSGGPTARAARPPGARPGAG